MAEEIKKYRAPKDQEEREQVKQFAKAGIELRFEDAEPGEYRLIFFGALPKEEDDRLECE